MAKLNSEFGMQSSSYSSGYRKDKGRQKRLTAQKRKEIKEAFDLFDTDGSGNNMPMGLNFSHLFSFEQNWVDLLCL